ncbi:MAG: HmuY family protein [Candidatus Kapaibacteriota bacterium]
MNITIKNNFKLIKLVIFTIYLNVMLTSCFQEDIPIKPYDRGSAITGIANIGEDYNTIIYYNLKNNKVVSTNQINDWDLAFETNDTSSYITLNPAIIGGVFDLGIANFDTTFTNSAAGKLTWRYDNLSMPIDSGAIGKWWKGNASHPNNVESNGHIYIVNLGIDKVGRNLGYRKLQIIKRDSEFYYIKFGNANSNGANYTEFKVPIDKKYHRVTFTFKDGGSITNTEPPAYSWDLVFTRYAEYFEEVNFVPYAINGVLLNPNVCFAYADSSGTKYEDVTSSTYNEKLLSQFSNVLGWDWKKYNFDLGFYTIRENKIYVIKDFNGYIYKLRFLDFYTPIGGTTTKGNISFEFIKL